VNGVPRETAKGVVTLTEAAAREVRKLLEGSSFTALRISPSSGDDRSVGLSLVEGPLEGDVLRENRGVSIVVDRLRADAVRGVEVDYIRTKSTEGFVVRSSSGCGCGPACGCR
jgi:Fe-S cluster assembly iron-binding protein IscA